LILPECVARVVAAHDRGVFVVCAGSDRGVHALASPVAPDRGPRREEHAERNTGGDEHRPVGDDDAAQTSSYASAMPNPIIEGETWLASADARPACPVRQLDSPRRNGYTVGRTT
jgi:hypothetical protein